MHSASKQFLDQLSDLDPGLDKKARKHKHDDYGNYHDFTDVDELIERILDGSSLHPSVTAIAGKCAADGWPPAACIKLVGIAFMKADQERYGGRWDECVEAIKWVYEKEAAKHAPPPKDDGDWRKLWLMTDGKRPKPENDYTNARISVSHDPALKDRFAFNLFTQRPVLLPGQNPVTDNDLRAVQEVVQRGGLQQIGIDNIAAAVDTRSRVNSFDPVLNYFEDLRWDGTLRLDRWMTTYLGAEDGDINMMIGRIALLEIVARQYQPGCKADYMPVFEHAQGELKSTVCRVLAVRDEWFSDNLPDLTSNEKDAQVHLLGKLVIEIAELHAFNRADATHLKSFITRTEERFRPPYGRMEVNQKRRCVFIGTTNKDQYLRDETGNRRYLPARLGFVDIAALKRDIDQLYAETVASYHAGAQWWPDRDFERRFLQPVQEERYDSDDIWEAPIMTAAAGKPYFTIQDAVAAIGGESGESGSGYDPERPGDYNGKGGGGVPVIRVTRSDQLRIKAILAKNGYVPAGKDPRTRRARWALRTVNKA